MKLVSTLGRGLQALGGALRTMGDNLPELLSLGWNSGSSLLGSGPRQQNTRAWLQAVEAAGRLRSAIDRYSKDMAGVRWKLMRGKGKQSVEVLEHPILDWMAHPWRSLGGGSWWALSWLMEAWLLGDGNNFWYMPWLPAECKSMGIPFEVWPMPPHWVQTYPRPGFPFFGVAFPCDEVPDYIPASRIIWMKKPSLINPYGRGKSAIHSVDDEVVFGEAANKYLNTFFRNSARPDMVLFAESAGSADVDRLERNFETRHAGLAKAFRPAVIPGKGTLQKVDTSFADMTLVELMRFNRDQVWQAFGLSPDLMGAVENSNRASIEAAAYHHQLLNLKPEVQFVEGELNLWFIPLWGEPDLRLVAEEVVQQTDEFRLQKSKEGYAAGLLERNEARVPLGADPLPEKDPRGHMVGQPNNTYQIGPDGKPLPWPAAPSAGQVGQPQKKSAFWVDFEILRLALWTYDQLHAEREASEDPERRADLKEKLDETRAMIKTFRERLEKHQEEA